MGVPGHPWILPRGSDQTLTVRPMISQKVNKKCAHTSEQVVVLGDMFDFPVMSLIRDERNILLEEEPLN